MPSGMARTLNANIRKVEGKKRACYVRFDSSQRWYNGVVVFFLFVVQLVIGQLALAWLSVGQIGNPTSDRHEVMHDWHVLEFHAFHYQSAYIRFDWLKEVCFCAL